jgi:hypothetical protein
MTRLTGKEWEVLLDAANAYEAEPANFEDDPDERRLAAIRNAIAKIHKRIRPSHAATNRAASIEKD